LIIDFLPLSPTSREQVTNYSFRVPAACSKVKGKRYKVKGKKVKIKRERD